MKKSYLYLVLSSLTLTACTSESVLEDDVLNRKEIGFQNVVQNLTRQGDVTDLTGNSLSSFQVFGYYTTTENDKVAHSVFNDVTVTLANSVWSYTDTKRYWVPGANYYFYAYSCGDASKLESGKGTPSFDMSDNRTHQQRVLKLNNYICNNTHQHDLIFASNTGATESNTFAGILGKESDNALVAFQFKHILSKVNARFTSKLPDDYTVEISNVKIKNICDRGSYNPLNGWSSVTQWTTNPFVYLLDTSDENVEPISTTAKGTAVMTNSAFVLPYKYKGEKSRDDWSGDVVNTYVIMEFHLTLIHKGVTVISKDIIGEFEPEWKEGYSYTYNINIDGDAAGLELISFTTTTDEDGNIVSDWNYEGNGGIDFKISVQEWEEGGGGTIVVPGR